MSSFITHEKYDKIQPKLISTICIETISEPPMVMKVKALWDTGAISSCITRRIVNTLELKPYRQANLYSATNKISSHTYVVNLLFNNQMRLRNVEVLETVLTTSNPSEDIDFIIGMDILKDGDFIVTNYNNKTEFIFRVPSQGNIKIDE